MTGWKLKISRYLLTPYKALFSLPKKTKTFQNSILHRILRHMHEVLNIDKNKLIAQFTYKITR